ncbi:HD domain-containing phosphohydrolase [Ammoniphilus sp. 3BR4]|uniref:HD domain-containing phosphohydrolase n=1 Tax=Ammoniphilus sp. 3BR4 TaxID=3158265 RepID=UPI0034674606
MPQVLVSYLKPGSTLSSDVVTSLGGLLFEKGRKLYEREIEILEAFLIEEVTVAESHPHQPKGKDLVKPTEEKEIVPPSSEVVPKPPQPIVLTFEQHFFRCVQFFRSMFQSVQGGLPIPIHELSESLHPLIQAPIELSNIMTTLKQNYPLDDYTYYHCISVGYLSACIARWSRFPNQEIMPLALTGVLHDIGKSKIDSSILYKPEKLSISEMKEIRKYPVYGYHLVKANPSISEGVALGVLQHQEREDGSGYPLGLQSASIHVYAKIIAISDIFHAMCSSKIYKQGYSPYIVLEQLLSDSFGKLDPAFVRSFVEGMTQFSIGTDVELQDGTVGKIVFVDTSQPTRPMVDVKGKIINLSANRNVYIKQVLVD